MTKIALVNMPFCSARAPSLQLGLIKALLASANIEADAFYFNLDFTASIGPELYELLSGTPDPMLGEWIFTRAAFPEFDKAREYLASIPEFVSRVRETSNTTVEDLFDLRDRVAPEFIRGAAKALASYEIIGFTSTFQQNVPSLALAAEIKRNNPNATIVFGGANVEGSVGAVFLQSFPCIDVVVNGECDAFVADLFGALLRSEPVDHFPSVLTRSVADPKAKSAERATYNGGMDALPTPDYADFFTRRAELGLDDKQPGKPFIYGPGSEYAMFLPFESSRGCWWGQKHHCTFCGLNAGGMKFRARSYEATVDLIEELHRKHNVSLLYAVDNIIDAKDIDRFCDLLIEKDLDLEIFYETKSNLRPRVIGKMAKAGIRYVQPGIESFSDHVLHLMRKGVSALHNLNTLRWFRTFNVKVAWNILYGFPGETTGDYDEQLGLVRKIHHLPPPARLNQIRIDRFSPNFFDPDLRAQFGELKRLDSYGYIYPDEVDRNEAAHFFFPREKPPTALGEGDLGNLIGEVEDWNRKWNSSGKIVGAVTAAAEVPFLRYKRSPDGSGTITDGRSSPAQPREIVLDPLEVLAYEHVIERPQDIRSIRETAALGGHRGDDISSVISRFEELGLIHSIGSKVLALATTDVSPH
jgi:ribosomal peptide maturation radical SAM protein 1